MKEQLRNEKGLIEQLLMVLHTGFVFKSKEAWY